MDVIGTVRCSVFPVCVGVYEVLHKDPPILAMGNAVDLQTMFAVGIMRGPFIKKNSSPTRYYSYMNYLHAINFAI